MGNTDTKYLTTAEVAKLYGVSGMTIRRWIHAGRIKALVVSGSSNGKRACQQYLIEPSSLTLNVDAYNGA